ncbi:MAG: hypothetical protein GX219_07235, partial [Tissierellia bacterium]|nr:hypothetical protein [Tissierellia bacterium]
GEPINFTYSISKMNYDGTREINIYKDEGGTYIRENNLTTIFHYPISKIYKAPDDFLTRLNVVLKDNKLNTKIKDASEEENGRPFYKYSVETEDGPFVIFEGSKFPAEYLDAFHNLDSFISEVVENAELIEDEKADNVKAEDIIGFEFNFHGSDVLLRKNKEENVGIVDSWIFVPSDELINKAIALLIEIPDMTQISIYKDALAEGHKKTTLNLFIKEDDTYKVLSKYSGSKPPLDLVDKYREIYELASQEKGED